ncbi:MAG: phosphate ABC transporter permease PstA [Trueperaceae bacterium]|nr:phosphate ABC transporter permease PstA [Trueperaceae bacterium]
MTGDLAGDARTGRSRTRTGLIGRRAGTARRQWIARGFAAVTLVPVVLAIAFVGVLLLDVTGDVVSWQVVEPANSGHAFAWWRAPLGGEGVIRLELAAQGATSTEIDTLLGDASELRMWRARNRVELMWLTDEGPFRWVVTNARDRRVADHGLLAGLRDLTSLQAGLAEHERLYLNPWLDVSFFARNASRTPVMAGLRTALAGTLWVIGLVMVMALPLGVGTAIYLEEYAPDNRLTRALELNIRNLAGVPSIVYGILGLYVFVRLWGVGPTVLAAALTLALLILPVVVIASREALRAVPDSLRQASLALGATRWQTVATVVLPHAVPGIVTGVILSVARAIGETAPLLLVGAAAFVPYLPDGPLSRYTVLPVQIYSWVAENDAEFRHVASAAILVLLVVLVLLYATANWLRRRFERTS